MVLPLALAHDDVYYYLLSLLIYATLLCLTHHWVQTALSAVRWFILGDNFVLRLDVVGDATMMIDTFHCVFAAPPPSARLIWDPGVAHASHASDLSRRLWDPGVRSTVCLPVAPFRRQPNESKGEGRQRDDNDRDSFLPWSMTMAIVSRRSVFHFNGQWCCSRWLGMVSRAPEAPNAYRVDRIELSLLALPMTPHAETRLTPSLATYNPNLLFHYSHPVLSCPTVPNI